MSLARILDSYNEEYWDFKNAKNDGIHKIANYPASMVAPMQHELLQLLVNNNSDYHKMLDPFQGSGVTLVERQEIGLEVFGIDLNMFVHNPLVVANDQTVYKTMQIFSPLLNYVFDILLIERDDK